MEIWGNDCANSYGGRATSLSAEASAKGDPGRRKGSTSQPNFALRNPAVRNDRPPLSRV
jgi:hypothetical protein